MILRRGFLSALMGAIVLVVAADAAAPKIAVHYRIDSSETQGETARGRMTVTVVNVSGGEINNVDLRLDPAGFAVIEQGVLQLGRIPADGVGAGAGEFQMELSLLDSGEPLLWRVDYDDAGNNHVQAVLQGSQAN